MVGTSVVEVKIMPKSPETSIEKIKKEILKKLPEARNIKIEVQEIAFGLKSLRVLVAWPENLDTDIIQNKLSRIEGVSYCNIEDIRRAFG